jgi:hypothetical protein
LYDLLVLGKGSAEDRAWVFAELLRQIGIDSVVLTPAVQSGKPASAPPRWLIGVLIERKIYLFDPILGWPIPSGKDKADSPTIRQPATLTEVAANDSLLRQLDLSADKPYPLHAGDLKSLRVEVIAPSAYWFPRLQRLETFFSGDRAATIFTPLSDSGTQRGVFSRVSEVGGSFWSKDAVSIWPYPDQQTLASEHLDPQMAERRAFRWLPFEGPVKVSFEVQKLKPLVEPGNRMALKARMSELQGDYASAVRNYLLVQLEELPPVLPLPSEAREMLTDRQKPGASVPTGYEVPPRAFSINLRASENSKFWMGLCQMELHQLPTASETFSAYIRRSAQAQGSAWLQQAVFLHSLLMAETKQFALAVQLINQLIRGLPEDDPHRYGYELLATRWRAARDAGKKPEAGTSDKTPPASKPSSPPPAAAPPKESKPAAASQAEPKPADAQAPTQKTAPAPAPKKP